MKINLTKSEANLIVTAITAFYNKSTPASLFVFDSVLLKVENKMATVTMTNLEKLTAKISFLHKDNEDGDCVISTKDLGIGIKSLGRKNLPITITAEKQEITIKNEEFSAKVISKIEGRDYPCNIFKEVNKNNSIELSYSELLNLIRKTFIFPIKPNSYGNKRKRIILYSISSK
jgi:hypothetical protein